jgi:Mrp family chromosome partitioning ATPase
MTPATSAVINACRQQFDMVIVDLPAIVPVVDVRAAAHLFDGFLMVTEWGSTTEEVLRWAIHNTGLEGRVVGTVLNKANMRRLRDFESAGSPDTAGNYLHSYKHIA